MLNTGGIKKKKQYLNMCQSIHFQHFMEAKIKFISEVNGLV